MSIRVSSVVLDLFQEWLNKYGEGVSIQALKDLQMIIDMLEVGT